MRDEALGVAEHGPPDPEGPGRGDGHHQIEHRRLLRGPRDEPAGRGHEAHGRAERQRAEQQREREAAAQPARPRHGPGRAGSAAADRRPPVVPACRGRTASTGRRGRASWGRAGRSRHRKRGHALPRPASSTTRSATASSAGRCTTSRTVRPTASLRTASTMPASVSPSSAAVGSSSSSTGRSARKARASARRCRCPAESPAPPSPRTVAAPVRQRGHEVVARPRRAGRRSTAASSASGRASRTFSAIVPANRCGRCGTQAIRSRQSRQGRASRDRRRRPGPGRLPAAATKPSSAFRSVDFPTPLGPVSATVSPGSDHEGGVRQGRFRAPGVAHRHARRARYGPGRPGTLSLPPSGSGVSRTSKISSAAESPSAAAWYCAPT